MTEKRFELKLCSNGAYYVYENGTLTDIDFDKFNKESADALIDEVNGLYDDNEQLKQRNTNQYNQLKQLWEIIEEKNWEKLIAMKKQLKEDEERLQQEWKCYE